MQLPEFEKLHGEDMYRHFAYSPRYGVWAAFSDTQYDVCLSNQKDLRVISPYMRHKPDVMSDLRIIQPNRKLREEGAKETDIYLFGLGFYAPKDNNKFVFLSADDLLDKPSTGQLFYESGGIMFGCDIVEIMHKAHADVLCFPSHYKESTYRSMMLIAGK